MTRRTVTRPEVTVDGWKLSSIAPNWGALRTSTRLEGDWQASFQIATEGKGEHWRHPALRFGAPVEVKYGPVTTFVGSLTEPDWDSGQMVALGACRDAENALSITASGVATTAPDTAIDAAISRGVVSWTRLDSFGTTPVGESDNQGGLVTPGSGVMGSAEDERIDRVFVRYVSSTTGALATASYPATSPVGGIERPVDITDRGVMDSTKATSIAEGIWAEHQGGRSGWTNGLTLTRGQVTTPGGVVADLSMIRAGQTMRLLGVPDSRGLARNTDVVIGDTEYDWTEDAIQINPVGLAARDDESVLEQVGNLAVDAMKKASGSSGAGTFLGTESAIVGTAPPAGARKIIKQGSVVQAISGAGGGFNLTYPEGAFPNGIVSILTQAGDEANGAVTCQLVQASHTLSTAVMRVRTAAGAFVPAGSLVRINYVAIGW